MFKFSCADFTFPVLERFTALRLVKLLGFNHVDLGLFARSTHFSPADLGRSSRSYTAQVLQELDALELQASDVFIQIGTDPSECAANDPDLMIVAKNRDIFKRTLEFCVALGCVHMTGLPGVFHPDVSQDRDLGLAREETAWRLAQCEGAGVRYAIEPHVGSILENVQSVRAFLTAVGGLTLTLDYGHFIMSGESSARVHDLLPFASHIHVRGGAPGQLQTPVDENTIDFPGMLKKLKTLNYDGFLTFEYVWVNWKGCNRTDNVSETSLLRRAIQSAISDLEMEQ